MGREVNRASRRWVKGQVGLVFQDPDDQLFAPTVWDDVAFGPANMGLSPEEIRRRVRAALEAVGAAELASRAPHRLSWGQKKRVAIAGVLAMDPGVLVLDEPTAFLDPAGREGLLRVLENLHREGRTLVMATHDVDLAAEWADEVVILAGGKVAAAGAPRLLTQEELVERCGLIAPTVTRLFARLRQEGMESGSPPLTMEEAVSRLRAYFSSADRDQRGR
jgi:cobalt/nickel transport system ATP-binding protein